VVYLAKVAEISRHDSTYIWDRMAYAQGLQFCTAWYQAHEIEYARPRAARSSLRVVL
jgi:hypothetical protein